MLNQNDMILVSVVGTEGQSRATKHVSARFDYRGNQINAQGREIDGPSLDLTALEDTGRGGAVRIPEFPTREFARAQERDDIAEVARLNLEYGRAVQQAQRDGGVAGGGVQAQYAALAKSVIKFLVRNEGFADSEHDAARGTFVLKAENVEITPTKVNGAVIYTVSGTAVFG